MARYILLAGVFINYFGVEIVKTFIDPPSYMNDFSDHRIIPYNDFYEETINELILVFSLLVIASFIVKLPKPNQTSFKLSLDEKERSNLILYAIYFLFFFYYLATINVSFSNLERGQGQFQVSALGSLKRIVILAIPFGFYALRTNLFGKKTVVMMAALFGAILINEISSGDRRLIGYIGVGGLLFTYYFTNVSLTRLATYGFAFGLLFMLAITFRTAGYDVVVDKEKSSFLTSLSKNLLLVNSDCAHLWWVKHYIESVTGYLGFINFLNHFIFLFIPTFVFQAITGSLSYDRPVFLFNDLFNPSTSQGYDFMMTADFYWHFGFAGYFVYIIFFIIALKLFAKFIYHKSEVLSVAGMFIIIYWIGGQRSDFGVFLKTSLYTTLFLYLIAYIRRLT